MRLAFVFTRGDGVEREFDFTTGDGELCAGNDIVRAIRAAAMFLGVTPEEVLTAVKNEFAAHLDRRVRQLLVRAEALVTDAGEP